MLLQRHCSENISLASINFLYYPMPNQFFSIFSLSQLRINSKNQLKANQQKKQENDKAIEVGCLLRRKLFAFSYVMYHHVPLSRRTDRRDSVVQMTSAPNLLPTDIFLEPAWKQRHFTYVCRIFLMPDWHGTQIKSASVSLENRNPIPNSRAFSTRQIERKNTHL